MDIEKTLIEVGLNSNEAKVYLATLELGESTVLPISKKSGIKRTYCYDILSSLSNKGLVSFIEKNGRRRYIAEDPKKIKDLLKKRIEDFEEIFPELKSIHNKATNKPKVRFYEGIEGLISVYQNLAHTKSLTSIGSPTHIEKYLGPYFKEKQSISKDAKIRDLVVSDGTLGWYHKHYIKPHQQYRFLPGSFKLNTDMLIFEEENKVALVSYGENLHAVVIEDSSIVKTFKALFDIIWQIANEAKTKLTAEGGNS